MEQYSVNEAFMVALCARTATRLGKLCRAEIGERCQLVGVTMESVPGNPPKLSAEVNCTASDMECPGLFLIEPAANEAAAQMRIGDNPDN